MNGTANQRPDLNPVDIKGAGGVEEGVNHPSWSGGQAVVVSLRWSHSRLHSLILSESLCLHPLHCDRTEAEHCPSCPLQSGDCAQSWGVGGGGGGGAGAAAGGRVHGRS